MDKYWVGRCSYDSETKRLELDAVRPMTEEEAKAMLEKERAAGLAEPTA